MNRCRFFIILALCLAFSLPLFAAGEAQDDQRNPIDPLDQGGETCATATPILTIPYCDTGTTAGHINDYPVPCQTGSTAPDVVYVMTPPVTSVLSFSLCNSSYNTALTIWRGCPSAGGVLICCSDNVCGDDACCSGVTMNANVQYYIVVDGGVAPNAGDYLFNVVAGNSCPNEPCAQDTCPLPSRDIEPINNNCGANVPNVTCGERLCGEITTAADRDWYRFSFTQFPCMDITIDVFGDDTPGHWPFGQGLNPKVSLWTDDCSTMIAEDDDGGIGLDSRLDSLCTRAGSYFILVESSAGVGPYELAISCQGCDCPSCPYPDGDLEPNNICSGGGTVLTCGDTVCGHITPGIDGQDYYYLDIQGPGCQNVTVNVFGDDTPGQFPFGQGLNPQMYIINAACDSTIAGDLNSGIGNDALIDSLCLPPGIYRLYVLGEPDNQSFGPYVLSVNCTPCQCVNVCNYPDQDLEPNGLCSGGGATIACGDTTCGEITPTGDNDYYYLRVLGPGCQLITIDVFGDDTPGWYPFGQGLDPLVALLSAACDTSYIFDDNSGVGNDARFQICLPPATYRLLVRSQVPATTGPYILATSCTPCACPDTCGYPNRDNEAVNNTCGTFNPPTVCGDTLCGELSANDLIDWYLITVVGPGSIRLHIDVFGNDSPGWYPFGQGLDPVVFLYGAGCTTVLGVDDNSGIGNDSHLEVCLPQGSYNIAISYQNGLFGPYILATHCEPCDTCPYPSQDFEPQNDNCGTFNERLHCNDAVCGEITQDHGINDDWYVLVLDQCTQLFIDVLGNDTPGFYPFGQGLNTAVELWRADCNQVLFQDQNSGAGEDARLNTVCLDPGIYMLRIYGENLTQGPYIIFVGCEQCTCIPPCEVICPPQAELENEPCPSLVDTVNGGCDTNPPRFLRLDCGVVYCGSSYFIPEYVDADWYRFGLTQPTQVRLCVESEFEGYLDIRVEGPGPAQCDHVDIIECLAVTPCQGVQCLSVCLPPGIYNVLYTPWQLTPCADYTLRMDCSPCEPSICVAPDSVVIHYPDTIGVGNELEDIVLYWPAVPGADEYRIYRSSNNNNPVAIIPANFVASTTDLFFVHEDVIAIDGINEIWIYQIVAYCQYDNQPCLPFSTINLPGHPDIITPRE